MIVIVDSNEQATNPKAVENMRRVYPDLLVSKLDTGDISVITDSGKRIAIERKKPHDFLSSIADGRLFNQVERMSVCDAWCVIITGQFIYDENDMVKINRNVTNWNGKSVRAAIIAVQMSGCPVLVSSDKTFPYRMREFINVASKPNKHQQKVQRRRIVTFPPTDLAVEILAQFNGVGEKRARSLLEYVGNGKGNGTIAQAIEWGTSIVGHLNPKDKPAMWGDKTVLNFRAALGLDINEYIKIGELKKQDEKDK